MFRKILVPLDGSTLAEVALPTAIDLARLTGADVTVVRAVEAAGLPGTDKTDAEVAVVREGEAYLDGVLRRLADERIPAQKAVWYGPAVYAITEAARLGPADLIVMCTHGRGGLGRLVLGSVAEAVLRRTTTPILLVRAAGAPLAESEGAATAHPR